MNKIPSQSVQTIRHCINQGLTLPRIFYCVLWVIARMCNHTHECTHMHEHTNKYTQRLACT